MALTVEPQPIPLTTTPEGVVRITGTRGVAAVEVIRGRRVRPPKRAGATSDKGGWNIVGVDCMQKEQSNGG